MAGQDSLVGLADGCLTSCPDHWDACVMRSLLLAALAVRRSVTQPLRRASRPTSGQVAATLLVLPAFVAMVAFSSVAARAPGSGLRPAHASTLASAQTLKPTRTTPPRATAVEDGHGDLSVRSHASTPSHAPARRASRSATRPPAPTPPIHRWVRPASGPLSSPFGMRWGRMHEGIDIAAAYGTPILAVTDGTIVFAGPEAGYGRLMVIRNYDGTYSAYGHMSRFVRTSGPVHAGEEIALVGAAGDSTGAHLHFEIRHGDAKVDPLPVLRAHGITLINLSGRLSVLRRAVARKIFLPRSLLAGADVGQDRTTAMTKAEGVTISGGARARPLRRFLARKGRPRWWAQLVLVALFYYLYDATRNFRPYTRQIALEHARSVQHWWIDSAGHVAATVNHWAAGIDWLESFSTYYYVVAHVLVTGGVLCALFIWRQDIYLRFRNTLFVISGISFVVYWLYPVAPPRLLSGYIDSVAIYDPFHVGTVEVSNANIYAAMPSLHVAWAVWVALALGAMLRVWWQRALVTLHPLVTVFVVLATGNHFLADVVAGTALVGVSYGLIRAPLRLWRRARPDRMVTASARGRSAAAAAWSRHHRRSR